jgi:hypothetical protein
MESSPSSRLSLFIESGAHIHSPVEGRKCGVAINVAKDAARNVSLKFDGVQLSVRWEDAKKCATAELPACGPGHYEIDFLCGDMHERRTITVVPEHFTEGEFNTVIHDLREILPKTIAAQLQECGGLSDTNLATDHQPTVEQEFFRLRRLIAGTNDRLGILQILPMLQRECHKELLPEYEIRKIDDLRRPVISKLVQAMAIPGNFSPIGVLKRMFDVTYEHSYNTYENRLVKTYVQALQSRVSRLQARLQADGGPADIAIELDALASEFRLAGSRTEFIRVVRPLTVAGTRVTMVLLKNPAYRGVLEDYLGLAKHTSVRLEEPALSAPLNNFPLLYQFWINLKVVSIMLKVCAELGYQSVNHPWFKRDDRGLFIQAMSYGEAALELMNRTNGKVVRIGPWRMTGAAEGSSEPAAQPPLAVAVYPPQKPAVIVLFSPRYNVTTGSAKKTTTKKPSAKTKSKKRPIEETLGSIEPRKEDVDQLKNCLKQVKKPEGVREIQYAAILYPGEKRQIAADLDALEARPSDLEELQQDLYDVLKKYLA